MTVEQLVECPDCGESHGPNVQNIKLCDSHHGILRALLIERGFGDELIDLDGITDEEYLRMAEDGERNAMLEVTQSMIFGVLTTMGPTVFPQYDGCPVCVLEGTLERAADEVVIRRRKSS